MVTYPIPFVGLKDIRLVNDQHELLDSLCERYETDEAFRAVAKRAD
jgi:hypothetical protein